MDSLRAFGRTAAIPVLLLAGLFAAQQVGLTGMTAQRASQLIVGHAGRSGMRVTQFEIIGEERTNPNILRSVLARHTGSIILTVDKANLKKELEHLPWVRSASVRVLFPDTLAVRIDEHRPFAWWRYKDRLNLVNDRGEIIPVPAQRVTRYSLPIVAGVGAPQGAPELFEILKSQPHLFDRLTAAHLVGGQRWNLYVDGQTEIRLPSGDVKGAWSRLAARELRDGLLDRAISKIDLRNKEWIILELEESVLSDDVRTKA